MTEMLVSQSVKALRANNNETHFTLARSLRHPDNELDAQLDTFSRRARLLSRAIQIPRVKAYGSAVFANCAIPLLYPLKLFLS